MTKWELFLKRKLANSEIKVLLRFAQGNLLVYGIFYFQNLLINSGLSVVDLGKYSYYQSILVMLVAVFSLTLYSAHLRFLGFVDEHKLIRFINKGLLVSTFIFCVFTSFAFKEWVFLTFCGLMWYSEELYFFRSQTQIGLYTAMKCTQGILVILSLLVCIYLKNTDYRMVIFLTGIAYLITYLFFRRYRHIQEIRFHDREEFNSIEILKYCIPGSISTISIFMLAAADQVFINAYLSPLDLSNYAMALRILVVVQLFTAVFMDYWPRFYFENICKKEFGKIQKMGRLFKISLIIFAIICVFLSTPIYILMGAKAYIGISIVVFGVLIIGEVFRVFGSINMTYRTFSKEPIYNVVILALLGVLKMGLNFLVVEKYGLMSLAYTTVFCCFLYWLLSWSIGINAEKKYMSTIQSEYNKNTAGSCLAEIHRRF